jgi:hypothetical protein
MRANPIGPPRSAALVISSAAVRMTGVPRSDDGTRNEACLTPPCNAMGSAKLLSQDTMQIRNRTEIQPRTGRLVAQLSGESVFR